MKNSASPRTYKTAQLARLIGVHPNTIRFYEKMALLPPIPRTESGYRIFTDRHLSQLRLLRVAFRIEIISDRLRHEVFNIIKVAAAGDLETAYHHTHHYLEHLKKEKANAEEALRITQEIMEDNVWQEEAVLLSGRLETAETLGITKDVLRDWERNGLINVPSSANGKRSYGPKEIKRLKIIRTLRNAHYSMMSILRMLRQLDQGGKNLQEAIDTPGGNEDIVSAADRYISALSAAEKDAQEMIERLGEMLHCREG